MTKTAKHALLVLAMSLLSLAVEPQVARADAGAGYCVWCTNSCPGSANHFCAFYASGCSAWLIPCTDGCVSIEGTPYAKKVHCGSAEE